MEFLRKMFQTEITVNSYEDFWKWFEKNANSFFEVLSKQKRVEEDFLHKLSPRLDELKEGIYYVAGMHDSETAELVLTADGVVKNIVFIEELVAAAPAIEGWKFTALKPAVDIKNISISIGNYQFNQHNISFYANDYAEYPDEIDITVVYDDFEKKKETLITNGVYIFLDNYLGELNFATTIDSITVVGKEEAQKESIPIERLKSFLMWREKEFVEKYEGKRHNTEKDNYDGFEATFQNGNPMVAIINSDLLDWDEKASHPWILNIELKYGEKGHEGMPNQEMLGFLEELEGQIIEELRDYDGYLNIGRQTGNGVREVYFACKDFRIPSKVLYQIKVQYQEDFEVNFDIYKDKYWQSFERFSKSSYHDEY